MYTSILLFALAGTAPAAGEGQGPQWLTDYSAARKLASSTGKPLAVFLGSGDSGWQKVGRDGGLGKEAGQMLAERYVCLYVNTDTPEGQRLAQAFQMPRGTGLVISDRIGGYQAFWHQGDLSNSDMVRYLQRYSDPNMVVQVTETNPSQRFSYYPSTESDGGSQSRYSYYPPISSPGASGSCPGGVCGVGGCSGGSCGSGGRFRGRR